MTAVADSTVAAPARRHRLERAGDVLLALVPAAVFVAADVFVNTFAGAVTDFPSVTVYRLAMNAGVLARFAGLFAAVILVWGLLRGRGASRWMRALAILSGPVAYGVVEFFRVQEFFPIGQAAYYAINPLFVAGVASQIAMAAVGEMVWRLWRKRRGNPVGRAITWQLIVIAIAGFTVLFLTVIWDGGTHYFYIYQQGYKALFG